MRLRDGGLEDQETKTLRAAVGKEMDLPTQRRGRYWERGRDAGRRRRETRGGPSEKERATAIFN